MSNYKQEATKALAKAIVDNTDYRVYLSARAGCNHGFFTDAEGSRVVSFQYDIYDGIRFSGNYVSKSCGTGWVMPDITVPNAVTQAWVDSLFNAGIPHWATKGEQVKRTSCAHMLEVYGASSMFEEVYHD